MQVSNDLTGFYTMAHKNDNRFCAILCLPTLLDLRVYKAVGSGWFEVDTNRGKVCHDENEE